jgi:hypothetical protein
MAYPVAGGWPDLSASTREYIPELYAKQLLVEFYEETVFGTIANTDYEGEIRQQGDTVHIRTLPDVTIRNYTKGQNLTYENPDPGVVDLVIDKGKYFAFPINRVDEVQSDLNYQGPWMRHFAAKLKIAIDTDVLANVYGDAHASNKGTSAGAISGNIDLGASADPHQITSSNILETIVNCGVVLDEQNVPQEGRWLLLPAWAVGLIKKSDLKDASLAGDGTSILRNGRVGMIDRFTIYMSNLIATGTDTVTVWNCVFGHKVGLTFASQMTETEEIPNPNDFGRLIRSLQVYGYKTVKSEAIGHLYVKQ